MFIAMLLSLSFLLLFSACGGQAPQSQEGTNSATQSSNEPKGSTAPQGVTDSEILIGHTGPQSGTLAIFDSSRKGAESFIKYVNENGGVNGRKLKLISYDDEGQPTKTVQLAKRLVEEDKVYAIVSSIGTVTNLAALDYYKQKGIPVVMLGSGSSQFVNPPIENVMGIGNINYTVEANVLLDYTVNVLNAKKIAIAYANDDSGKEYYEAVKNSISKYPGVSIVAEVKYLNSDVDFTSHAQKLQESNPDAVMNFSAPNSAANLKKAMYKIGLNKVHYIVNSNGANDTKLFELAGNDVWQGTISAATIPMPGQSDDPSLKLFVERFSKDYPNEPLVGVSQLGWAQTEVFVEALRRAGDNLAWKDFLNTFYTFDNWDGSIYTGITFSKNNHYGVTSLFMTEAKDGNIVPITDAITFDPDTGEITYK